MSLSDVECLVLRILARGVPAAECARVLDTDVRAVYRHQASAMKALGARSKLEAILAAAERGLIELPPPRAGV
ncbi:MAG: hypothetical protein IT305_24145 [Chloroflexi bacterium]|nr:hypothetical protein [Chloroflexota bacterium]